MKFAAFFALILLVTCPFWLRLLAKPLIVSQDFDRVDAVALFGGDRRYDFVKDAISKNKAPHALIFESQSGWVVKTGALLPAHENDRRQLLAREVSPEQITLMKCSARNVWERVDHLNSWFSADSNRSIAVVVGRFQSREVRYIVNQVLPEERARRVFVVGLKDRRYDEDNWWKSRIGFRSIFGSYLRLGFAVLVGRPPARKNSWNPDAYEELLRAKSGKQNLRAWST